jgi:O-antigen ligase
MATIAWGVLAFGAVYPWAYWPLSAGAAALGAWGFAVTRAWGDPRILKLGGALTLLVVAISTQIVALPYEFVTSVSPGVDRFLRAYHFAYRPLVLHPFSLAPEATVVVLCLAIALSLLLLGLLRIVRHLPLEWLIGQLMGLGVALALFGIVQKAFLDPRAPLLYGFWSPRDGGNPFGPFVNRNHFAGWMTMVLPMVAMHAWAIVRQSEGRLREERSGRLRWFATVDGNRVLLIGFSALVMAMALVFTGSRSGVGSLSVAALVMLLFIFRRLPGRGSRVAAASYIGVVLLGAVAWAGSGMVVSRFAMVPAEVGGRLAAWRDTATIVEDFPVFGVGLGAFGRAMLVYQSEGRDTMYAQAHNDYLQLAAEGGLVVGIPAAVVALLVIGGIRRRLRSSDDDPTTFWIRRGAVAGLAGIAAQSLVEFSLQMPGNAALFVVVLAVALHRPRSPHHARRV